MAERPWVQPIEVTKYTEYPFVAERPDLKLAVDISRAEHKVIQYTNNAFEEYESIPEPVKNAVILIAEVFAYQASVNAMDEDKRPKKSVTFDDYSWTAQDAAEISLDTLDLGAMLDDYVIVKPRNSVTMKLRKL